MQPMPAIIALNPLLHRTRNRKFESSPLEQRVLELSVPGPDPLPAWRRGTALRTQRLAGRMLRVRLDCHKVSVLDNRLAATPRGAERAECRNTTPTMRRCRRKSADGDKTRVKRSLIDDLATRDVDARPVRVYALRREAVAALPHRARRRLRQSRSPPLWRGCRSSCSRSFASSRPAISFCNLEKRHEDVGHGRV